MSSCWWYKEPWRNPAWVVARNSRMSKAYASEHPARWTAMINDCQMGPIFWHYGPKAPVNVPGQQDPEPS